MTDKWEGYEALAKRQQTGLAETKAHNPLEPINQQIEDIRSQELDLIGQFKRNKIERKAAIEKLRALHDASLEAAKHALTRAVDVEKERVDTVANKYIFAITQEYLRNMRDLGLQNFDSRMETLLQLNERMARLLEKAQTQDVPPSIREATLENITKKYREFADRLMQEEITLR